MLSKAVALALGAASVAQRSPWFPPCWIPPLSAPVLPSVRRACSLRRERRSPSCPRSHHPGSHRRSATYCPPCEPRVPTSFGELLVGSFSIAPQPPTSRLQVGGWRLLLTLPLPRPLPLPHHTPTPRRGHATGRSLGSALPAQPLSLRSGARQAGAGRRRAERPQGTPDRGRWNLRRDASATAAAGTEQSGPGD